MRYLHPVGPHETPVASGAYRYFQDETPTGLLEYWTIHQHPDGAWFFRVDRDGRDFDGRSEWIEAWQGPTVAGQQIERFDVAVSGLPGETPRRARATYTLDAGQVHVGRWLDHADPHRETLTVPASVRLYPGGDLFFGRLLPALAAAHPPPLLARQSWQQAADRALAAFITHWPTTYIGPSSVMVDGKQRTAHQYTAAGHTYWIDPHHHILLRHQHAETVAQLERYTHRRPSDQNQEG